MSKRGQYEIPFTVYGDQLHQASGFARNPTRPLVAGRYVYEDHPVVWTPNHEFVDTLTFVQSARGWSGTVHYLFERQSTQRWVTFFQSDFEDVVPLLNLGKLTGQFTFIKRGNRYGTRLIEQER